jgi:hypothetical protein
LGRPQVALDAGVVAVLLDVHDVVDHSPLAVLDGRVGPGKIKEDSGGTTLPFSGRLVVVPIPVQQIDAVGGNGTYHDGRQSLGLGAWAIQELLGANGPRDTGHGGSGGGTSAFVLQYFIFEEFGAEVGGDAGRRRGEGLGAEIQTGVEDSDGEDLLFEEHGGFFLELCGIDHYNGSGVVVSCLSLFFALLEFVDCLCELLLVLCSVFCERIGLENYFVMIDSREIIFGFFGSSPQRTPHALPTLIFFSHALPRLFVFSHALPTL